MLERSSKRYRNNFWANGINFWNVTIHEYWDGAPSRPRSKNTRMWIMSNTKKIIANV